MIATLEMEGFTYPLIDYHIDFKKDMNPDSTPATKGDLKTIKVTYVTTKDEELLEWSLSDRMQKHMVITLFSDGLGGRDQRFEFYDIICTSYYPNTRSTGQFLERITTIEMQAAIVVHHNETLEKPWKVTNVALLGQTPMSSADEEEEIQGQIHESYFEDVEGNAIEDLEEGEEIYYILNTQDLERKIVNVNLADSKVDFEYKGQHLKDDMLNNIQISSPSMKIPLTVVKQKS